MANQETYKLKHPIELRNKETGAVTETITEFTIRRPKGKQLKAMDRADGEVGRTLALMAAVCDQPPSVMDQLDVEDFAALGEVLDGFFGGRLLNGATGGTSSAT